MKKFTSIGTKVFKHIFKQYFEINNMKLVVLIPALNEEEEIGNVISKIPRKIIGFDKVEVLIIDDGSTDKTVEVAINTGADRVVSHQTNLGIGASFMTGVRNSITMDADVLVIIDADSQFDPELIPSLVKPILSNQLDVVLGSRFLNIHPKGIPKIKLYGNKIFTKLMSLATGQKFTDTQSGFVAYAKDAILNLSVTNEFTFVHEAIIDLKFKGFRLGEIPVSCTYYKKRKSRVVKSIFNYSTRAISIIIRSVVYHRPILTFSIMAFLLIGIGLIGKIITYTKIFGFGVSAGLSTGLIILGIVSFMLGLFAYMVFKRQMFTEKDFRYRIKELDRVKEKKEK